MLSISDGIQKVSKMILKCREDHYTHSNDERMKVWGDNMKKP
jgi:hypothetical protein